MQAVSDASLSKDAVSQESNSNSTHRKTFSISEESYKKAFEREEQQTERINAFDQEATPVVVAQQPWKTSMGNLFFNSETPFEKVLVRTKTRTEIAPNNIQTVRPRFIKTVARKSMHGSTHLPNNDDHELSYADLESDSVLLKAYKREASVSDADLDQQSAIFSKTNRRAAAQNNIIELSSIRATRVFTEFKEDYLRPIPADLRTKIIKNGGQDEDCDSTDSVVKNGINKAFSHLMLALRDRSNSRKPSFNVGVYKK